MKITFDKIIKEYRTPQLIRALNEVSWEAHSGEIFGILGPNGAGKSTMIKVLLKLIQPESGNVFINDEELKKAFKKLRPLVGYMPEERGLYQDEEVIKQLTYLGSIKGLDESEAKKRALQYLERFELLDWQNAKIGALSKGMTFKIQLIACILHDPEIVILDEPFYGLDPVNLRMVRNVIYELKEKGKLVLLSTHMMNEVEKLCDKIIMMYKGKVVLSGDVIDIQKKFSQEDILINNDADLSKIPFISSIKKQDKKNKITLNEGKSFNDLMQALIDNNVQVSSLEKLLMPLENIFISIVKQEGKMIC